MFRVKKRQFEVFEDLSAKQFEQEMILHVTRHFPNHLEILGERRVREVVRQAAARARARGHTAERDIFLYLTFMLMLGGNFEADILLPWVGSTLDDPHIRSPILRMEKLTHEVMAFLDNVSGRDDAHVPRILARIHHNIPKILACPSALDVSGDPKTPELLRQLFPRKYEAVGDVAVGELIRDARRARSEYGITGWRGNMIYLMTAFILGSGFDTDPLLPWASEALRSEPPEERAERLLTDGLAWLDRWLAAPRATNGAVSHV